MPFTIPNVTAAGFADQAEPDSVDIDILTAGHSATGVVSGCAVTAQGSPDMTVAVASGTVSILGVNQAVTSGNVTITAAHATLARKDIVVVGNTGTKSVTAGTAAAQPLKPAVPANSVVLAEVYVPAADPAVNTNQITDKRVIVGGVQSTSMRLLVRKSSDQVVTSSTVLVNDTALVLPVGASSVWKFEFDINVQGSSGNFKYGFTFPTGGDLRTMAVHVDSSAAIQDFHSTLSAASGTATGTATTVGGPAPKVRSLPVTGVFVNSTTAGNVTLQWAQQSSSATATTVKANSSLWGYQLA